MKSHLEYFHLCVKFSKTIKMIRYLDYIYSAVRKHLCTIFFVKFIGISRYPRHYESAVCLHFYISHHSHFSDYEYVDINRMMVSGNYKKAGRSWVWEHFHQSPTSQDVHGKNKWVCLHCSREFSQNTSTGNLAFHLAGSHNLIKPNL